MGEVAAAAMVEAPPIHGSVVAWLQVPDFPCLAQIGKTVQITRGKWKGRLGIIKARVCLRCRRLL